MQHMGTQLNPKTKAYEFGSVVLITHFSYYCSMCHSHMYPNKTKRNGDCSVHKLHELMHQQK